MDRPETLVKLQEADLAEVRARRRLDELPEKLAILETRKKRREVEELRDRAEQYHASLRQEVSRREDEAAGLDEKVAAEQAKVMSGEVTNPKELQNLTREMDALRRRKDKLENETLGFMEKIDKASGQLDKIGQALTALDQREAKLTKEFKAKGGELQKEIDSLHRERETLARSLDAETRAAYEETRAAKSGLGVGVLDEDTCTACRVQLPAERLHQLKTGPDVGKCPNCRRLLVVRRKDS